MANLAIHGGKKINPTGVANYPKVSRRDKAVVMRVLDRGEFWGQFAPEVAALQSEWADYVGRKYCLATNSGTAALHIAICGAGVQPGDEVITTALTFVATAHAILQRCAVPVFVDIDPVTFNIDPQKIEAKISKRTKAIMPVHLHGLPADMDEINAIARKHNLVVIEDACQAHGATYKGKKAGALADMAGFSLNGSKNLPGCEGGLFVTDNDEYRFEADKVRSLGEIIEEGVERDYNAFEIGWMYRYTEMNAAFTRSRLERLDAENAIRAENADYLTSKLNSIKGVDPPVVPPDRTSVYHLYRMTFKPQELGLDCTAKELRAKVQKAMRAEGLQAMRWQNRPVPMQQLFQRKQGHGAGIPWSLNGGSNVEYKPEDYPVTREVVDNSFVLHSALYPPNGKKLVDVYAACFEKFFGNLDELMDVSFEPDEIYVRD